VKFTHDSRAIAEKFALQIETNLADRFCDRKWSCRVQNGSKPAVPAEQDLGKEKVPGSNPGVGSI